MIEHLNRGRDIAGEAAIPPFVRAEFPTAVEMARERRTPQDYFDAMIVEHWEAVVQGELAVYLEKYFEPSAEAKRVTELEIENAQLRALLEGRPAS